jgi:hypothetical protein
VIGDWLSFFQGLVGAVLLAAAVAKIASKGSLRPFLLISGFPAQIASLTARLVAPIEGLTGLLLVAGLADLVVGAMTLALSAAFITVQLRSHKQINAEDCRCFGFLDVGEWRISLARSIFLGLGSLGVVAFATASALGSSGSQTGFSATAGGAASGAAFVAALALLGQVLHFEQHRPQLPGVARAESGRP